ncbi:DUF3180 domain-containing protein [Segeticoccus rhizosphaerae]|uniref:DUF3180 domain-containing protein n=1 Tax=Segeticoccus rhizosphaerae TaxID=1104777 RepID=UPI0013906779|nr:MULTISPECIES: DUF3180 domain-containing protein [Intrasporangiaceae]
MVNNESGVSIRVTVLVALVVGLLAYVGLRLVVDSGHELPQTSWLGVALLVLMAAVMLAAGWEIRRYLGGDSERMPTPQRARRTVVAAQASALGGAVVTGYYAALAVILVPNADVSSVLDGLYRALALCGAAILLAVVGHVVQAWCRIPHDHDDDPKGGGGSRRSTADEEPGPA